MTAKARGRGLRTPTIPARTYCVVFILLPIVIAAAVACVNIIVDVEALYWVRQVDEDSDRVAKFVNAMLSAPNGVHLPSCCQRLVKLELARLSKEADCLVIGSSREMQLGGNIGGRCKQTANLAVYGGAYEDTITLLFAAAESRARKTVFIGMDPWGLRRNIDDRWHEFETSYARAREEFGLARLHTRVAGFYLKRFANLFSIDYACANLGALSRRRKNAGPMQLQSVEVANDTSEPRLMSDGSLRYEQSYIETAPARRLSFGTKGAGAFKISRPWFEESVATEFAEALKAAQSRGITPVLLLTPYAPEIFRCQTPDLCEALSVVEPKLKEIARDLGVELIGSYDARRYGLTADAFYDNTHLTLEAVQMLFGPSGQVWREERPEQ